MKVLINSNNLDGYSTPFSITSQVTVFAYGLEPGDEVTFSLLGISKPVPEPCVCPPGAVTLPAIVDELPLTCCEDVITLTRDRPWVVLDAPQHILMRAHLTPADALSTQVVVMVESNTPYPTDFMRGCACGA
jgi:hypothetical protein